MSQLRLSLLLLLSFTAIVLLLFMEQQAEQPMQSQPLMVVGDCELLEKGCRLRSESGELELTIASLGEVTALVPFALQMFVSGQLPVEKAVVRFEMVGMKMPPNQSELSLASVESGKAVYQGEALLPVCVSGRSDWLAVLQVETSKGQYRAELPFVLISPVN